MNYDPELAALLSQPWSNDACRGYVIAAMERCGFKPSDIEQVMVELYEVFDYTTLQEAALCRRPRLTTSGAPINFWTLCPEVHIRPKASTFPVLAFAMFQDIL